MQGFNLSKISRGIFNFFGKTVEKLDEEAKFVRRDSKLTAPLFVETLVLGCLSNPEITLEGMSQFLKERGVSITKQGLDQRFNSQATTLLENLLAASLKKFKTEKIPVIDLLKPFSAVKIQDSSGISLPESLKEFYMGFGGSSSEAGLKIQVMFDYFEGQIESITVTDGRKNDQSFNDYLSKIQEGALYLQDLGYFKLESLKAMQDAGSYFISRYLNQTLMQDRKGIKIDLLKLLKKSGKNISRNIRLGKNGNIEVRLVGQRVPREVYLKRIKELNKKAKKNGCRIQPLTRELAKWSIFVTNIPKNILNDKQVYLVYSLRWQIELFFKLCKSEVGIDKISSKNPDRVRCEFFAKLISITMMLYICFPVRWSDAQEISFRKAYKLLRMYIFDFFKAFGSTYKMIKFLEKFIGGLKKIALKDKGRPKRLATHQKLMKITGQEVLA